MRVKYDRKNLRKQYVENIQGQVLKNKDNLLVFFKLKAKFYTIRRENNKTVEKF